MWNSPQLSSAHCGRPSQSHVVPFGNRGFCAFCPYFTGFTVLLTYITKNDTISNSRLDNSHKEETMIGFSVVEVFEALRERGYAPFESDVPGVCLEKNGLIVGMHYEKTRGTILDRDGLIVDYGPTPASVDPDPVLSLPTTAHSYIVMLIIEK